jgi:hypothetical protein
MKKYGIVMLCDDTDGFYYVDNLRPMYDTMEEAEKEVRKAIQDELETLNGETMDGEEHYHISDYNPFVVENIYDMPITTYNILEFEVGDK